jgi:hypothetical protein
LDFRIVGFGNKVDSPELHVALRSRMASGDANVRRRAAWILYAIGERGPELQAYQGWDYRKQYRDFLRATERKTKP